MERAQGHRVLRFYSSVDSLGVEYNTFNTKSRTHFEQYSVKWRHWQVLRQQRGQPLFCGKTTEHILRNNHPYKSLFLSKLFCLHRST